jgi:hypothetical protein
VKLLTQPAGFGWDPFQHTILDVEKADASGSVTRAYLEAGPVSKKTGLMNLVWNAWLNRLHVPNLTKYAYNPPVAVLWDPGWPPC